MASKRSFGKSVSKKSKKSKKSYLDTVKKSLSSLFSKNDSTSTTAASSLSSDDSIKAQHAFTDSDDSNQGSLVGTSNKKRVVRKKKEKKDQMDDQSTNAKSTIFSTPSTESKQISSESPTSSPRRKLFKQAVLIHLVDTCDLFEIIPDNSQHLRLKKLASNSEIKIVRQDGRVWFKGAKNIINHEVELEREVIKCVGSYVSWRVFRFYFASPRRAAEFFKKLVELGMPTATDFYEEFYARFCHFYNFNNNQWDFVDYGKASIMNGRLLVTTTYYDEYCYYSPIEKDKIQLSGTDTITVDGQLRLEFLEDEGSEFYALLREHRTMVRSESGDSYYSAQTHFTSDDDDETSIQIQKVKTEVVVKATRVFVCIIERKRKGELVLKEIPGTWINVRKLNNGDVALEVENITEIVDIERDIILLEEQKAFITWRSFRIYFPTIGNAQAFYDALHKAFNRPIFSLENEYCEELYTCLGFILESDGEEWREKEPVKIVVLKDVSTNKWRFIIMQTITHQILNVDLEAVILLPGANRIGVISMGIIVDNNRQVQLKIAFLPDEATRLRLFL